VAGLVDGAHALVQSAAPPRTRSGWTRGDAGEADGCRDSELLAAGGVYAGLYRTQFAPQAALRPVLEEGSASPVPGQTSLWLGVFAGGVLRLNHQVDLSIDLMNDIFQSSYVFSERVDFS
jgi:hypothetical protein